MYPDFSVVFHPRSAGPVGICFYLFPENPNAFRKTKKPPESDGFGAHSKVTGRYSISLPADIDTGITTPPGPARKEAGTAPRERITGR